MFFIEIVRYLFGYVNFRAFGGFSDRFLNLCAKENIPLWNVQNNGGRISGSTTTEGYLKIRFPARKSGMRVRCLEKKGLLFFLRRNKARVGLLIGAALSVVLLIVLTQFVWNISVVGNTTLEDDYILSSFEKYGVKVGSPISSVDLKKAASQALSDMPELSWAAVNRKGTVMVIEVRERTSAPPMYDSSRPTNLTASEDGVVVSLDILNGVAAVKTGSAVTKGDLLISGIITHRDNSESLVHADGHVRAATKKKEVFRPSDFSVFSQVTEKTRSELFFFGLRIPLSYSVPQSFFTEHKSFLESGERLLPVGIIKQHGIEFSSDETAPGEKLQSKLALFNAALYEKDLLSYSEVKKTVITEKKSEFGKEYEFYGECEQEIGKLQEIYVEKTSDIA